MTASTSKTNYERVEARFRRIGVLKAVDNMLGWDAAVMMPPGGAKSRAEQLAVLRVMQHEMCTDPKLEEELAAVDEEPLDG